MKTIKNIAFIGLGNMGLPMAINLVKNGFNIFGYDLNEKSREAASLQGIPVSSSVKEIIGTVDAVITMLPDSPDVEQVTIGEFGIDKDLRNGAVVIDMSSINPLMAQRIALVLESKGIESIDAPVSGGIKGAVDGSLSIMVGGKKEVYEHVRPILNAMGKTIIYAGKHGNGQAIKLCNQIICAMNIQAISEALALGRELGIDLNVLRDVLMGGSADSWMLRNLGEKMINGEADAGFRIALQLKDLKTAFLTSYEIGVPLPGLALVTSLYLEARAHDEDSNGNQALFRVYDRMANQSHDG